MRNVKTLVAVLLLIVVAGIGAGVLWWLSVPHSADEQFAYAEKLEKQARADAVTSGLEEARPKIERAIGEYAKVETWGKGPKAGEAWGRAARIEEEVLKDDDKALKTYERISKDYAADADAGHALIEQARLIRKQAETLKVAKAAEAIKKYKAAIEKLEEYRKKFTPPAGGKWADYALLEIGRIWQDGIGEPPINAIEAYRQLLRDYAASEYRPEAMYRLARMLETVKATEDALRLYAQLQEQYPTSPWAKEALYAQGELLKAMDEHKEAAEKLDKFAQEFGDDPRAKSASGDAQDSRQTEAQGEREDYGRKRYGGAMPPDTILDTLRDQQAAALERAAAQKLDAQKYELDVTLAPADHRITVNGTLDLINRGEEKKELFLLLAGGMNVTSVTVDGVAAKNELSGGGGWRVTLPAPLKKDGETKLAFAYSGEFAEPNPGVPGGPPRKKKTPPTAPATATAGSGGATTGPAGVPGSSAAVAPATGAAKRPGGATGAATRTVRRGGPIGNGQLAIGNFGYGLSGGSWYPITIIGDVFTAKVTFHAPPGVEVVGNGAAESRDPAAGRYVFETKRPVFGLYFCYGKYKVQEKTVGKVHYYTYLREPNAAKSDAYIACASSILDFYSEKFGPFAYEKMAIVESPLPPFLGGVGPASMMILHEGMVAQKDVPTALLAHELAHQWFGNQVPINLTDPGYHQWLSEGFATYADALYTERTEGKEALALHIQRYTQLYFMFQHSFGRSMRSVKDTPMGSPLYRPVVYEKGALILHSLRKVMGDAKFFALLQRYVGTYADKTSTVNDFRRMASDVMGEDLSWFFAQWFDQTVYARWTVADVKTDGAAAGAGGGGAVKVTILVQQKDALVRAPVDITLLGAKGERHVVENTWLDKYEQTVELTCPFVPVKIVFDEGNWVLKAPGSGNVWPVAKATAAK